jgi:hypothetical protein
VMRSRRYWTMCRIRHLLLRGSLRISPKSSEARWWNSTVVAMLSPAADSGIFLA